MSTPEMSEAEFKQRVAEASADCPALAAILEPAPATQGETPRTAMEELRDMMPGERELRLERELAESKALHAELRDWCNSKTGATEAVVAEIHTLRQQLAQVEKERDEARRDRSTMETRHGELVAELAELRKDRDRWKDCAEYGWTIIANAGCGNWNRESKDWQGAAVRFRTQYYACLDAARNQQEKKE